MAFVCRRSRKTLFIFVFVSLTIFLCYLFLTTDGSFGEDGRDKRRHKDNAAFDISLLRHHLVNHMKGHPLDDVTSDTSPRIKVLENEGELRDDTETDRKMAQVMPADQPGL